MVAKADTNRSAETIPRRPAAREYVMCTAMSVLEIAEKHAAINCRQYDQHSKHEHRDGCCVAELSVAEGRLVDDHSQRQTTTLRATEGAGARAGDTAEQHQGCIE